MIDVVLAFDTEDYVTPEAWDAQLWWAQELSTRGIRGSFQCVGQLIRVLKARARRDVIEALGRHEIGYHTEFHSIWPTHAPGTAEMRLDEGIAWVLRQEAEGLSELVRTFGRMPVSFCAPGDVWTAATILAMGKMGIKVMAGSHLRARPGVPEWFVGMLWVRYDMELCFDNIHAMEGGEKHLLEAFDRAVAERGGEGVACFWSHPTTLVTTAFWDVPLSYGARLSLDELPPAPLRSTEQMRAAKDRVRRVLDGLQKRRDVRFTDLATVYGRCHRQRRDLDTLMSETGLSPGREAELARENSEEVWEIRCPRGWPILPKDFDMSGLDRQAMAMRWTWAQATMRSHDQRSER